MDNGRMRCLAISDFTIENFTGLLTNDPEPPAVEAMAAPFGQVTQALADAGHPCWRDRPDLAIVWTRPQGAIASFARLLDGEAMALATVLAEVDAYAALVRRAGERAASVFVPTWVRPLTRPGAALLDMRHGSGIANVLMHMNLRLAEQLQGAPNIHLLDAQPWVEAAGARAGNPKLWYLAKVPFGPEVFHAAAQDIKAALRGLRGEARRLILMDLDDTLWGGLVGEVGWERLTLGGHDPAGEAYADFQRALKALTRRGVVLGIVSKNDEAAALDAIARHPEMALRPDDFAGWRINWQDKAQNVADLAAELNLGLQSVVFIDDHPAERARVREALPEVLVPEWPDDPMLYPKALAALRCFETVSVSREDRERTALYAAERRRADLQRQVGSADEWLATLGTTVRLSPLRDAALPRATQLLNKTNQMNLSTRRLTEAELSAWARGPHRAMWTVHVSDRFGDAGLTGLVSLEADAGVGRLVDFVLSCRVMGRKVEETMLAAAIAHARERGLRRLVARHLATARNAPCLEFLRRSGWTADGDAATFAWDASRPYPAPAAVRMVDEAEAAS